MSSHPYECVEKSGRMSALLAARVEIVLTKITIDVATKHVKEFWHF